MIISWPVRCSESEPFLGCRDAPAQPPDASIWRMDVSTTFSCRVGTCGVRLWGARNAYSHVTEIPAWHDELAWERDVRCCSKTTPKGSEPLRAEPNGFLVHHLSHSVTVSLQG